MLRNAFLLSLILIVLSSIPPGSVPGEDPWENMERGLRHLNVENVTYQVHIFIPEENLDKTALTGLALPENGYAGPDAAKALSGSQWSLNRSAEPDYTIIQVKGTDQGACRRLWEQLGALTNRAPGSQASAWSVDALISGSDADLNQLGLTIIDLLEGSLHSINSYNGTVQILAHVPRFAEKLLLEDGPFNLSLELYAETHLDCIRIRAGTPVLLSFLH